MNYLYFNDDSFIEWRTWMIVNKLNELSIFLKKILEKLSKIHNEIGMISQTNYNKMKKLIYDPEEFEMMSYFLKHAFKKAYGYRSLKWYFFPTIDPLVVKTLLESFKKKLEKNYNPNDSHQRLKHLFTDETIMPFTDWLKMHDMHDFSFIFSESIRHLISPRGMPYVSSISLRYLKSRITTPHYSKRMRKCILFLHANLTRKTDTGKNFLWFINTSAPPEEFRKLYRKAYFDHEKTSLVEDDIMLNAIQEYSISDDDLEHDTSHFTQPVHDLPAVIEKRIEYSITDMAYLDGEFA
jgi:hypothetical protein